MLFEKQMKVFKHASDTVPFYIDLYEQKKICELDINRWHNVPITTKDDLVLRNDSFISARYLSKYLQGKLICTHTSGSTGKCANVFWEPLECNRSLLSLWLQRKKYYGINPHDRFCYFFTSRNVGKKDIEIEHREYSLGFCKSNLNEDKLVDIWNTIREYKPIWMILQPSIAVLLCKVVEKRQLQKIPSLRYIETTGEMLFLSVKSYIENVLGVVIANQYGCNEMNSIAYECPKGFMHCMEENVLVEVVDSSGQPLPDGEEGEICITTLTNYAMPLIRYKIGDRGCVFKQECSCGNSHKILKLTSGRSNDWVIDKYGNKINSYIFVRCVENVNKVMEHAILQFQVIQKDYDLFLLKFVIDEEISPDMLCQCFIDNLWHSSLSTSEFEIEVYPDLFPDEKNGKLKWFISELENEVISES